MWSWVWLSVLNIFYDIIMLTAQIYDTKNIPLSLNFSANINTYFSLKAKCWLGGGGGGGKWAVSQKRIMIQTILSISCTAEKNHSKK